jgi:holo-ACP synthase CitX
MNTGEAMSLQEGIYNELKKCYHVSLAEILDGREKRVFRQQELLEAYIGHENQIKNTDQVTLICFTMNIAGPVKSFELAKSGFEAGIVLLEETFKKENCLIMHHEKEFANIGYTAYYVVKKDAVSIKKSTIEIEDNASIGRLFDIDVLILDYSSDLDNEVNVRKIGRNEIGNDGRKCLICDDQVAVCARSRRHSVEDLQRKTIEVLLMNK